jgi:hypothetical protein
MNTRHQRGATQAELALRVNPNTERENPTEISPNLSGAE